MLTRDEQVRVAKWMKFENEGPLLFVERFMQQRPVPVSQARP